MRRHATALSLGMPIEGAPRNVSTTVDYTVEATEGEAREVVPEIALRPGQVAPGITLPSGGTEAQRPFGSVAPSSTLAPGGTETQRPRGFVAPSSTLPALAP
jgi:hypothetical protein